MQKKALTGAGASAEAMRQINPDVVAAYPITPQTPIMETFAKFVNDGKVSTELIRVESEHSAMSAVIGASSAGARAMTATSSVGLALMFEVVNAASGMRLPITMPVVNRALSSPINIHCDHSDTMACRDAGWIQLYSENAQEAYDNMFLAQKLSEHPEILLPTMIMQDGFITSHSVEPVEVLDDETAKSFIGSYNPEHSLLLSKKPVTFGALQLFDYFFETKRQQELAMDNVWRFYYSIADELTQLTGRQYPLAEPYHTEDAEVILVALNSAASTIKAVVNKLRKQGKKAGLLKIRLFRPFPYSEVSQHLQKVKSVGVFDRSYSFGANSPLLSEIISSLFGLEQAPKVQGYIFGLGGRDLLEADIEKAFEELFQGKTSFEKKYLGLRG
ncbi:MAG TPA: pyruvate ferredoxin oxidoreductase [Candidatus Woesearchaeota archaeon]|mgnify:CR=1 FL=1|nr:pyruvate ferredoxin oxidoreductase [Candidatus Woesearchaeota archaeon]